MMLNLEQRKAVETLYGPLLVLSGAGSGKTRVVTHRIAHLLEQGIPASSILALTFTNKAAEEMKTRVLAMTSQNVLICTFHSLGAKILRESIHHMGYTSSFTIYDEQDTEKLMKTCLSDFGSVGKDDAKSYLHLISKAKNAMKLPADIERDARSATDNNLAAVYASYQRKLKECNAADFDDLLLLPVVLFKEHPDVLDLYRQRWEFLLIDEYQDTNGAQYALVNLLVEKHRNLCVVGDPDQSIYSWRGANIGNILDFEKDFPGAVVILLEQNYRSRSNILEAANALIKKNWSRYEKKLWSDRGPGEKIRHYVADTEKEEAEFIADRIRFHYENGSTPLKEMAIFYRTNAQSRPLEDRLLLHRIPYTIVGGVSFYQRKEIKDVIGFLRMVQSGVDFVSFARTINIPKRGLGDTTIEKLRVAASEKGLPLIAYCKACAQGDAPEVKLTAKQKEALRSYLSILDELREIAASCSIKELVSRTIRETGYLNFIKEDEETFQDREENLSALVAKAAEWENASEAPTLEGFLEELSLKSTLDDLDASKDKVRLMTVHNAKGLEFDVVFIAGMEEDLFPHANSRDNRDAQEEERRLCYVGMTRAKEHLYLLNARQRFLWGASRSQHPSRFLAEIPENYLERLRPAYRSHAYARPHYSRPAPRREDDFIDDIDQAAEDDSRLHPGDAVFHHEYGIGVVTQAYLSSVGLTYKIVFSRDNKERTLVAKAAALQKV